MQVDFPSEDKIIDQSHSLDELKSCLYFLIDDGEVVYVGQSTNVIWRLRSHIIDSKKKFDSYTLVPFPPSMLNEAEAEYIVKLRPKYNKQLPPNSQYVSWASVKNSVSFNPYGLTLARRALNIEPVWENYYTADDAKRIVKMARMEYVI